MNTLADGVPDLSICKNILTLLGEIDRESYNRPYEYCSLDLVPLGDLRNEFYESAKKKISWAITSAKVIYSRLGFEIKLFHRSRQVLSLKQQFKKHCASLFGSIEKSVGRYYTEPLELISMENLRILRDYEFSSAAIESVQEVLSKLKLCSEEEYFYCEKDMLAFFESLRSKVRARRIVALSETIDKLAEAITDEAVVANLNGNLKKLKELDEDTFASKYTTLCKNLFETPIEALRSVIARHPVSYKQDINEGLAKLTLVKGLFILEEDVTAALKTLRNEISTSENDRINKYSEEFLTEFNIHFKGISAACIDCDYKSIIATLGLQSRTLDKQFVALKDYLPCVVGLVEVFGAAETTTKEIQSNFYLHSEKSFVELISKSMEKCVSELEKLHIVSVLEVDLLGSGKYNGNVDKVNRFLERLQSLDAALFDNLRLRVRKELMEQPRDQIATICAAMPPSYNTELIVLFQNLDYVSKIMYCFESDEIATVSNEMKERLLTVESSRIHQHCLKFSAMFDEAFAIFANANKNPSLEFKTISKLPLRNSAAVKLLNEVTPYFPSARTLSTLFAEAEKDMSEFRSLFFHRVEKEFQTVVAGASKTVESELARFHSVCCIEVLLLASGLSKKDVDTINSCLVELSTPDCLTAFENIKARISSVTIDAPTELIYQIIKAVPETYVVQLQAYFQQMDLVKEISCVNTADWTAIVGRVKAKISEAESMRVAARCTEFRDNFAVQLLVLVTARRSCDRFEEISKFNHSNLPFAEQLTSFCRFLPSIRALVDLFQEAEKVCASFSSEFYCNLVSSFANEIASAEKDTRREFDVLKICSSIEVLINSHSSTNSLQLLTGQLKELQVLDEVTFEEYRGLIRTRMFEYPLVELEKAIHAKTSENYQSNVERMFDKLSMAVALPICCDVELVKSKMIEMKELVLKTETDHMNGQTDAFVTSFKSHFGNFVSACVACQSVVQIAQLQFETSDVSLMLEKVQQYIPYSLNLLAFIQESEASVCQFKKQYFNRVEEVFVEELQKAKADISKEIMKFRAKGGIELLLLLPQLSESDVEQMNTELESMKANDNNLFVVSRSKVRQTLFELPLERINVVVQSHPKSYCADLTKFFDQMSAIRFIDYCFEEGEIEDAVEALLDRVQSVEKERMDALYTEVGTSFKSAIAALSSARRGFQRWNELVAVNFEPSL